MTEREDPSALAGRLEKETDRLQERGEELHDEIDSVRQDWERKRQDDNVPGAQKPMDTDDEPTAERSPAPQAPPPEEGPSSAETPPEGAAGPPKTQLDEDDE